MYYPPQHYIILCIDPGTDTLGVGVLGLDLSDMSLHVHEAWTVHASSRVDPLSIDCFHGNRQARLKALGQTLGAVLERVRPHAVISEAPFLGRFPQSFEALVQCVNMIRQTVYNYDPALFLQTIDPPSAKKAVGAVVSGPDKKESVRQAILRLPLYCYPGVNLEYLDEHTIDALAVGIYLAQQIRSTYGATTRAW